MADDKRFRGKIVGSPSFRKSLPLALLASLAVLSFQNCIGSAENEGASSATQLPPGNGNGVGYDGKLYLHNLADGICPDGTKTESTINFNLSLMTLLRENCVDIPGGRPIQGAISADGFSILYNEKVYYLLGSGTDQLLGQNPVAIVEDTNGEAFFVDTFSIARINSSYTISWAQAPNLPEGTAYGFKFGALTSTGELAVVGQSTTQDTAGVTTVAGLVAFMDASANIRLARSYSLDGSTETRFDCVAADGLGSLFVSGWVRRSSNSGLSPVVLKLDSDGAIVWQRTFAESMDSLGLTSRAALAAGGGVVSRLGSRVASLSADGVVNWSRQLSDPKPFSQPEYFGIAAGADGGLLVAGRLITNSSGVSTQVATIARINGSGALDLALSFDLGGNSGQAFEEIAERADRSLLLHGHWVAGNNTRIFYRTLMSLNPDMTAIWAFGMLAGVNGYGAMSLGAGSSLWVADSSSYFHLIDNRYQVETCPFCNPKSRVDYLKNSLTVGPGSNAENSILFTVTNIPLSLKDVRDKFRFK